MGYQHWDHETLLKLGCDVFKKLGFNEKDAWVITDVLLAGDLYGIESHGIQRLYRYYKGIRAGMIHTDTQPETVFETPVSAVIDGHDGMGQLIAHKSERTGKRFIRCSNFDECGTSYPLPQRGKLEATGETCPDCGAPMVIVHTQRGPWKLCVNMNCPAKEKKTATRGRSAKSSGGRKRKSSASKEARK